MSPECRLRHAGDKAVGVAACPGAVAIAPHWLRGQYLTRQRSYTSIAAALGARTETAIAAAREAEARS